MIARFLLINICISLILWGIGRILTTPELRKKMYYPLFLVILSTCISLGLVFLERSL